MPTLQDALLRRALTVRPTSSRLFQQSATNPYAFAHATGAYLREDANATRLADTLQQLQTQQGIQALQQAQAAQRTEQEKARSDRLKTFLGNVQNYGDVLPGRQLGQVVLNAVGADINPRNLESIINLEKLRTAQAQAGGALDVAKALETSANARQQLKVDPAVLATLGVSAHANIPRSIQSSQARAVLPPVMTESRFVSPSGTATTIKAPVGTAIGDQALAATQARQAAYRLSNPLDPNAPSRPLTKATQGEYPASSTAGQALEQLRNQLIAQYGTQNVAVLHEAVPDPSTGMWYVVVDQGDGGFTRYGITPSGQVFGPSTEAQ